MTPIQFKRLFEKIQVVRTPKYRLATFGTSRIHYRLITDVKGFSDRSRLRTGHVIAEKPGIITVEALKNRFSGFGPESDELSNWLIKKYGQALRGLEYQFRHEPQSSKIELTSPDTLMQKATDTYDKEKPYHDALLKGSDKLWEMSVMKFIVEETLASFSSNVNEFEERGFFEAEDRHLKRKEREIQFMLQKARRDPSLVKDLGKKLKEYGLFEKYQDEFFRLVVK